MANKKCCVPDCSDSNSKRHRFPRPDREIELFRVWLEKVKNPVLQTKSADQVHKSYLVCDTHFNDEFKVVSHRGLTKGAFPTLLLPGESESSLSYSDAESPIPPKKARIGDYDVPGPSVLNAVDESSETPGSSVSMQHSPQDTDNTKCAPCVSLPVEFDADSSRVMDDEQIPGPSNVFLTSPCLPPAPVMHTPSIANTLSHPEATTPKKDVIGHKFDADSSRVMDDEQIPGPSNVFLTSPCLPPAPVMHTPSIANTLSHPEATTPKKDVIGHKFDADSSLVMNNEDMPGTSNVVVTSCPLPVPSITYMSHLEATKPKKVFINYGTKRRSSLGEVNETRAVALYPRATDIRYFPNVFMTEFIRVYKQHPSLWKIKSREYTNKNLKNVGITKLIEVCKQFRVMEADKEFVLKKIQSIRDSFRKENKKVKDSQRHGTSVDDIYVPTLWYFDLLKFTLDQDIGTEGVSNYESATSEISESSEESQDASNNPQVTEEDNSQNEEEEVKPIQLPAISRKRAKKANTLNDETTVMFTKACTEALSTKNATNEEFQAVGNNVSAKLQKMKPKQQAYAEFLIQKVLTWGALEKLTENTDLVNSRFLYRLD